VKGDFTMRSLCVLCWLIVGLAVVAAADDDRSREEAAEADRLCAAELPHLRLMADGDALDTPTTSVLRWTNPFDGRVYGNTYVWLRHGQPAAVGCLYRHFHPHRAFCCELAALTGTKLVAKRNDIVVWQPKDEWAWHPVRGADPPAATASQRLVQMRALAREFTVEELDKRNLPKGEDQTPRLLPTPLYRYDVERTKPLDGALYAFVLGTDPELFLLLECATGTAQPQWQFGVGRMNRFHTRLKRKGETVWEAVQIDRDSPEDVYLWFNLGLP
jgi:hypothetical protein